MKIREDEEQENASVNLTPMIDIVFLLIIFFMVSTSFIELEKDMEIDLPEASSGESSADPLRDIVVNLRSDGTMFVDGKETTFDALRYLLQRAAERDPEQAVTIRGDRVASLENVVHVLDACKVARIHNISLKAREEG